MPPELFLIVTNEFLDGPAAALTRGIRTYPTWERRAAPARRSAFAGRVPGTVL
jgi:hypothetical protein